MLHTLLAGKIVQQPIAFIEHPGGTAISDRSNSAAAAAAGDHLHAAMIDRHLAIPVSDPAETQVELPGNS
jgi:hypothetical protein